MNRDDYGKYSDQAIQNAFKMMRGTPFPFEDANPDWVMKFEHEFAKWSGKNHNIAVNSGTSALHTALAASNIGPGDEVIMPAMSVVMNAYAALAVGATPVFADINEQTWNIDLDSIQKVYSEKTRAIITVSWFGMPVDLFPIMEWAKPRGIIVIEDAAESLGATYKHEPSGQIADFVAYSFENKKHLTTGGEGGMVSTGDSELATKARKFAGLGYKHLTADQGRTSLDSSVFQRPDYERYDTISLNYRLSPLSAAVGLGQLPYLDAMIKQRIHNANTIFEVILNDSDFRIQTGNFDHQHSYYTAAVCYSGDKKWVDLYNEVKSYGGDGFYGCVMNPYLEPVLRRQKTPRQYLDSGLNPIAENLQPKIMALKTNFRYEQDLNRNVEAWKRTLAKKGH